MTVRNHVFDDYMVYSNNHVEMVEPVHLMSYLAHEFLQKTGQENIVNDASDLSVFLCLKCFLPNVHHYGLSDALQALDVVQRQPENYPHPFYSTENCLKIEKKGIKVNGKEWAPCRVICISMEDESEHVVRPYTVF
ncbi:hypothetical protein CDAR_503981 [Caerostris darwini]|uniref:Uncharacterized protein n=1 Tax=Caerostris darwini TaxID=1538125 RepID=A0AAV4PE37_9ARAC|nr:hypothetical protein CDAR_503981 [Caerostris darwini]